MEQRLANTSHLTLNQKKFIETTLLADLRADGRRPFDYRNLTIKFGKEEGSAEVQLGQTHVMAIITAQLVQPYRDRPNDGTLSIFTEFSPMADPSFEPGRPGESPVELGRVINRGLREIRAVDTESLCVLSGKLVWAIPLAALLTFRRPEVSLGGEDGQEVIVHPPEEREPLHLIIHHLPIAVTFSFFNYESSVAIDPTHEEEAFMGGGGGGMTATINANGDVCAIQKAGGDGRIASVKAGSMTEKIKKAVDSYNTERAFRKIKCHTSFVPMDVDRGASNIGVQKNFSSVNHMERLRPMSEEGVANQSGGAAGETELSEKRQTNKGNEDAKNFTGGPSSWDPYSNGVDSNFLKCFPWYHIISVVLFCLLFVDL
ncbi:protein RRP45A-like [Pyrus ussuriensis x Pyrus communis]|uniref:Protein RRP45A-like n=1 Tax=Pyrus ussuriensis x Pyrus communis TaxID=2448454 RepID=A0A5N5FSS2_9ROSA|nr:protein RRP45A-like [Pyrus ussuriensis x Pyrus communis]